RKMFVEFEVAVYDVSRAALAPGPCAVIDEAGGGIIIFKCRQVALRAGRQRPQQECTANRVSPLRLHGFPTSSVSHISRTCQHRRLPGEVCQLPSRITRSAT